MRLLFILFLAFSSLSASVVNAENEAALSSPILKKMTSLYTVRTLEMSSDSKYVAFSVFKNNFDLKGFKNMRFGSDGKSLYFIACPTDTPLFEAREDRYGKYNVVREDANYQHVWRAELNADMRIDGKPIITR
jgi:hypothetical protein